MTHHSKQVKLLTQGNSGDYTGIQSST